MSEDTAQFLPASGYVRATTYRNDGNRLVKHYPIVVVYLTGCYDPGEGSSVSGSPVVLLPDGGLITASDLEHRWVDRTEIEIVRLATMGDRIGCPRSPGLIDAEGNPVREDGATR